MERTWLDRWRARAQKKQRAKSTLRLLISDFLSYCIGMMSVLSSSTCDENGWVDCESSAWRLGTHHRRLSFGSLG
jgi:hypothetical protein